MTRKHTAPGLKGLLALLVLVTGSVGVFGDPITLSLDGGKQLDQHWKEYSNTGDTRFLSDILDVLNWDDQMKLKLTDFLDYNKDLSVTQQVLSDLETLGMHVGLDDSIDYGGDFDVAFGVLLRGGKFAPTAKRILETIGVSQDTKLSVAVKSSAFWSIVSMAKDHEPIRSYFLDNSDWLQQPVKEMLTKRLVSFGK